MGRSKWQSKWQRAHRWLQHTGLLAFVALCVVLVAAEARAQTFHESGGLLVIEAESVPPTGDWQKETSLAGYTGTGYYRWNGPLLLNDHSQGIMGYQIHITNPGTYNLRLRSHHPPGDQYNDCWTSVDSGSWTKTYASAPAANQWVWHTQFDYGSSHPSASYNLSAGAHTFYISGRAPQFSIDRIHLYLDTVTDGTNAGHPESSTSGGGGSSEPMAVATLALVDADSDELIGAFDPLVDGDVLNLATLPTANLNVLATVTGVVGSVRFTVDGGQGQVESSPPYALAGDDGQGDFDAWTPPMGSHTITATPFAEAGGSGTAGDPLTISFTVINETPDPGGAGGSVGAGGAGGGDESDPSTGGYGPGGSSSVSPGANDESGQAVALEGEVFGCTFQPRGDGSRLRWLAVALLGLLVAARRRQPA